MMVYIVPNSVTCINKMYDLQEVYFDTKYAIGFESWTNALLELIYRFVSHNQGP